MARNNITGAWGESIAAQYLLKKGYKLLACGYRCRYGEIDLIVSDRKHIVFVEVKLRKSNAFAQAHEFVDQHKQERIRTTAGMYLSHNPSKLQSRFDVMEIYAPDGIATQNPEFHHMEGAF